MNRFSFRNSVMLVAILVTPSVPVIAQQHHFSGVHVPIVTANDPIDPNPVPPTDPTLPPQASAFALHF